MHSVSFVFSWSLKVSSQSLGGKEILDSIKRDMEEIVNDSLSLNMICYCQQLLSECDSKTVQSKYHCRLCQKSLGYKSYDCNNESCIYKRVSGLQFWICPSCYAGGAHVTLDHTQDGWKQIFVSKLKSSMRAMS